ncbi:TniQ family protein [Chelativorans sp. SCAU2101]|uniref:TniQ family protein n=1 Tax=Chelativorans petroleitrophicus TaxID=2975484 RepID=A0A9X2X866_9HYPH|nr:TniQ family protein [Chelativorans petroleitrophicus]MCT8991092.1 TniQ family protein [Chelativorans petroleitrophicus]
MRLALTLELGDREIPSDFASRLSTRACRDDMREFCHDFGIDPQAIINGDPDAIQALADLARVDGATLLHEAFSRIGCPKRQFRHREQVLLQSSLVRNRVRMCPACMAEDIERLDCRLAARPHRRSMWLIRGVRTCAKHGMVLREVGKLDGPRVLHDTSRVIAEAIPRLRWMMDHAVLRDPSRFERYLLQRLDGETNGSWLDGLPMYAAMHLTLVAGAVAVHGPSVTLDEMNADEAWRCEAAGFNIVDKGAEGIREFLDELQAPHRDSRSSRGPKVMYGRLYDWLAHECRDRAYDPVREIIIDHSLDTLALGPNDVLFGRKVGVRRKHSVRSASEEFGLHPKRLRKLVQRAKLTGDVQNAPNNKIIFNAAEADAFLKALAESMSLEKLRDYLNVPRPHDRGLVERGFIKPMVAGGRSKGGHAFRKSDLDDFLARLLRDADPALHEVPSMVPLIAAAKHSCCAVMDVVALVLDRKLSRIGRDPGQIGFLSVLVDAEEVRPLVTGPAYDGYSLRDVERLLPAKSAAVKALIEKRFLMTETVKNPVTGWMQPIVRREELARFRREYVSLNNLARERGEHFARVKKSLVAAGVYPVADPTELKLTLYRRSDIP